MEPKKPSPVNHYTAMANDAAAVVRITAERDALQLRLNDTDQRNADLIELMMSISHPQSIGEAFSGAVKIRKYLGALKPVRIKCDGNHGGPRCGDPECWNDGELIQQAVQP